MVAFLQGKNCFPSEGGGESRFERGEVALDSTRGWILLDEKKIFNSELLSFGFRIDMDPRVNLRQRKFLIVFFREVAFL